MKIADSLRAINLYPINPLTVENIAEECGLNAREEITASVRASNSYKRAKAKVYQYLAEAPQVTEAGATYNFTDAEREAFRRKAQTLLDEAGAEDADAGIEVGYLGEDW